jgi:hypothetical protein
MSNLLPEQQKKMVSRLYHMRYAVAALVALCLLLGVGIVLLLPTYTLVTSDAKVLDDRITLLESSDASGSKKQLADMTALLGSRLSMLGDRPEFSLVRDKFIDPVLKAKSDTVRFTNLSYVLNNDAGATAQVEISGVADTRESLLSFGERVRAIPNMKEVVVPITSFIKGAKVPFVISAKVLLK